MSESAGQRAQFLENLLGNLRIAVTYADSQGNILYVNGKAKQRPSKIPRQVGTNIRDCHKDETNKKIARIFADFAKGRREPHHYVSKLTGKRELVTLIPFFEGDIFVGCLSQIHPLGVEGIERSFS